MNRQLYEMYFAAAGGKDIGGSLRQVREGIGGVVSARARRDDKKIKADRDKQTSDINRLKLGSLRRTGEYEQSQFDEWRKTHSGGVAPGAEVQGGITPSSKAAKYLPTARQLETQKGYVKQGTGLEAARKRATGKLFKSTAATTGTLKDFKKSKKKKVW